MTTINEALALAIRQHRAGNLAEAERIYRQVAAAQPNHPQPWHLLGLIANQVNKPEVALPCLERAIALKPDYAEAICDLGTACDKLGRQTEALEHYRRATSLKPEYAEAHYNLGCALHQQGQPDAAIAAYRRALELRPDFIDVHNNLGLILAERKEFAAAADCFRRTLELDSSVAGFHHNLGIVLHEQGQDASAVASLRRALELDPRHAESEYLLAVCLKELDDYGGAVAAFRRALSLKDRYVAACTDLGVALHEQGKLAEALVCHLQAVEWNPESFEVHNNLGAVYQDQSRLDLALFHYHRALELKPGSAETYVNLGITYRWLYKLDDAWEAYHKAIAINPDYAAAHVGIATLRLTRGDFEQGWAQFEWRWKMGQLPARDFPQPLWDGQPLPPGTTILLHAEQGFGDAIQFARYAPLVKDRNPEALVILECEPQILKLFTSLRGVDRLVVHGDALPRFDTYAPLGSLPRIFQTRLDTIPRNVPYLQADPALIEHWREKLAALTDFRVGINWHGREGHLVAQRRDIPLRELAKLAEIPGVQLISLQKGATQPLIAQELAAAPAGGRIFHLGDDFDTVHGAFMDTAAVMKNLDLVITSDTSVAHLAGALGVPVWVALPFAADWRWLLHRSDSPWYPTMRLFRQSAPAQWTDAIAQLTAALRDQLQLPTHHP